jgi:hypothetical protein
MSVVFSGFGLNCLHFVWRGLSNQNIDDHICVLYMECMQIVHCKISLLHCKAL